MIKFDLCHLQLMVMERKEDMYKPEKAQTSSQLVLKGSKLVEHILIKGSLIISLLLKPFELASKVLFPSLRLE